MPSEILFLCSEFRAPFFLIPLSLSGGLIYKRFKVIIFFFAFELVMPTQGDIYNLEFGGEY